MTKSTSSTHRHYFLAAVIYSVFIIYGSLVPLDFHNKPLNEAIAAFLRIRYLQLGMQSRADWIANILLYIPLSFFLTSSISQNKALGWKRLIIIPFILLSCIVLAVIIEFSQQFFPPRTVSQNDLIAESLGSLLGIIASFILLPLLNLLRKQLTLGGKQALTGITAGYTLAYLLLSLFPYDFVTNLNEFNIKMLGDKNGLIIAPACGNFFRCSAKLTLESLLTIPLGIFFGIIFKRLPTVILASLIVGFLLSLLIESLQLFLITGVSQGISLLTRMCGTGIGAWFYQIANNTMLLRSAKIFNRYQGLIIPSYLFIILTLNGWSPNWDITLMAQRYEQLHWLPFYYHYYTSEAIAATSLLYTILAYAPIGAGYSLHLLGTDTSPSHSARHNLYPGLIGLGLALVVESGKLIMANTHPDPTNLLIALISATLSYSAMNNIAQQLNNYNWKN